MSLSEVGEKREPGTSGGPRLNWPGRFHYAVAALLFFALAAYGSVVPLNYLPLGFWEAVEQFKSLSLEISSPLSRTDSVVNVLLFVPIGYCLLAAMTVGRNRAWLLAAVPAVLVLCALSSLAIEFAQLWIPARTASLFDVVAQLAGTLIGIGLWLTLGRAADQWLHSLRFSAESSGYLAWILKGYLAALAVWLTLPLDLTVRPAELLRKHREGRIKLRPFAELQGLEAWIDLLTHVIVFVPVGMLAAIALTSVHRPLRSPGASLLLGSVLVAALCGVQLLTFSQHSDSTDLVTGMAGVLIGVLAMHWWRGGARREQTLAPPGPQRTKAVVYLAAAGVYCLLLVALFCRPPFQLVDDPQLVKERLGDLFRAPLSSLYHGSIFNAVKEVIRKTFLFVPLGVLGGLAVVHLRLPPSIGRIALGCVVLAAAVLASGIELAQVFLPPHVPDVTDVLLCTAGAAIGVAAVIQLGRK